jgi:tetratricopeptide (TPR) repeat protein
VQSLGPRPESIRRAKARPPSLPESLLRPFIDLEPCARGPLYAQGIEQYWNALIDKRRPKFALQRTLPCPFRAQFLEEVELEGYQVEDPRELSSVLKSGRWATVCDTLDLWPGLTIDQQSRLVLLLHALCFYSLISRCIPTHEANIELDADKAELAYWGASARYVLGLPNRVADYGYADMSEFERIVVTAPQNSLASLNAVLKLLVHKTKVGAPIEEVAGWCARGERLLGLVVADADDFDRNLLLSRFHRAAGFIPQRYGDSAAVVRTMDLAEHYARAMVPADDAQKLVFLENLHPVMESRTKEALWIGDLDLALSRALRVIDLDPYDSKTWLELGQVRLKRSETVQAAEAYATAAVLGPPASAVGRHMAGHCFRDLGQPMLAAFFFRSALEVDPLAISPHDQIQALPDLPVLTSLKEWSLRSFEF